jgi:hypothetical protein
MINELATIVCTISCACFLSILVNLPFLFESNKLLVIVGNNKKSTGLQFSIPWIFI